MSHLELSPPRLPVASKLLLVGLLLVVTVLPAAIGLRFLASSASSTAASAVVGLGVGSDGPAEAPAEPGAHGLAQLDGRDPAVANLDPDLLAALRRAAVDAAGDGVEFVINSGWRSEAEQAQLLQDAISTYGSEEEAARWVAPPDRSTHVFGDAVDVGPFVATAWLAEHGAGYGLCQTYGNEPWHYELRPDAAAEGCPQMYADATHDPRMQP